jgi:hypothetical protein
MSTPTRPDIVVMIQPDRVSHWLQMLHAMADKMRELDGRRLGAVIDLMADDVATCAAAGWYDRERRKVEGFEFRATFAELPDRGLDIQVTLTQLPVAA